MFTLDYVRPVGKVLAATELNSDLCKIYNSRNPIYGCPGEFYYFDYGNGFAKAVHKRYAPYLDEIYKIEALINNYNLDKFCIDQFVVYLTPKFEQAVTEIDNLANIAVNISKQLSLHIEDLNLVEIVLENEILVRRLFNTYSSKICDLLHISSIKCQVDLFEEMSDRFCHNDFHTKNIFIGADKKNILIDFEMALFHRSSTDVELINYSRFNQDFKKSLLNSLDEQYYKKVSQMLAVKNLLVLVYLMDKHGWKNNAEIKKFQKLFYQS